MRNDVQSKSQKRKLSDQERAVRIQRIFAVAFSIIIILTMLLSLIRF
jgi:hypothetical protein